MILIPKKNRKKGFTLIELIVVVAILAILAAIAVPSFIGLQQQAKLSVDKANASIMCGAINVNNTLAESDTTKTKVEDVEKGKFSWDDTITALGTLAPKYDSSLDSAASAALISVAGGVASIQ